MYVAARAPKNGQPVDFATPPSSATTPAQMRHFYGIDSVTFGGIVGDGTGQTIAIVDVFDDPNAKSDLQHFDNFYGLADPPSFLKYNQNGSLLKDSGGNANPPSRGTNGNGWQIETSLDIEWAHVIAPKANIALVECSSASLTNLFTGVINAAGLSNVAAVSMSWGAVEFSGESSFDSNFSTTGVVFLAATGDGGSSQTNYPAASSNVVAVGGTTIQFANGTTDGTYGSESTWSGGGGRISQFESKPTYQNGIVSGSFRGTPDISLDADPNTGVAIYDSYDFGTSLPWAQYGGTSLSTPMWAGLVAIIDQGRATASLTKLSGRTQFLPSLYTAPSNNFHDVTTGSNGTLATVGYDTATGIGTPVANKLLNTIAGVAGNNQLAFTQPPASTTAGNAILSGSGGVKVAVQNSLGQTITTDSSTVTLTLTGGTFAGGGNTATAQAVNGIATFTSLIINTAGSYTLTATDGTFTPATSSSFNINAAAATSLVYAQSPTNGSAGSALSPSVVVDLKDNFGNLATSDNSLVTINLFSGPGAISGTEAVHASSGVATFSSLIFTAAGTYKIQPTDGALTGPVSSNFTISAAQPANLVFIQEPTDTTTGNAINPAVVVDVQDQYGNLVSGANFTVTLTLGSGTFSTGSTTASVPASSGVATFNNLEFFTPGTYSLNADGASLPTAASNSFNVTMVDVLSATNAANLFTLKQNPDGLHIDWILGTAFGTIPINDPNGLTLNGDANNDPVTLDYSNGNPFPNILHLNGTFTVSGMQGSNAFANTQIEIGQSTVYFAYTPSSPAAQIQGALAVGYNGGAWNGTAGINGAITSSTAAGGPLNTFGIGYADSADGIVVGQPANTVEVRYTALGDANLDRTVNSTDAVLMTRNYMIVGATAWDQGNFNYDSAVNFTDAQLLQKNFNTTVTISAVSASATTSATASLSTTQVASSPTTASTATSTGSVSGTSDSEGPRKSGLHRRPKFQPRLK
jgi:subtilase family serine protease